MNLRIVNTCNSNCLYCLEQEYRLNKKFLDRTDIFDQILKNKKKNIITFYWWNSLLHPDLEEIITLCKNRWFESIWILSNTFGLDREKLLSLTRAWLNSVWFYFNSFNSQNHDLIVNGWISLSNLVKNIALLQYSGISYKAIIHINKQNINTIYHDVYILNKRFWVQDFEFINYFPFDRPYDKFRDLLEYNVEENRTSIDALFRVIRWFKLKGTFLKFSRNFFWKFTEFYNFQKGIQEQIWPEDTIRLWKEGRPYCHDENRCEQCFITDICSKNK